MGAVGAQAVVQDLNRLGLNVIELERGSTGTKMWKEVKRKWVRVPDLVCKRTGLRIECRAKKDKPLLAMSHSDQAGRSWDFGMTDEDVIAFPVCSASRDDYFSNGELEEGTTYWRERHWTHWNQVGAITYFRARQFRQVRHDREDRKGRTEGSEATRIWKAARSNVQGVVEEESSKRIGVRPSNGTRIRRYRTPAGKPRRVAVGDTVDRHSLLAAKLMPESRAALGAALPITQEHIERLLSSRQMTERFTGVKLARVNGSEEHAALIEDMAGDPNEDVYVRMEGHAYLCSVTGAKIAGQYREFLEGMEDQDKLEAVISISEVGTPDAARVLTKLVSSEDRPYFLRSAAAWGLGQIGTRSAQRALVAAFGSMRVPLRQEALSALVSIGGRAAPVLLDGLRQEDDLVAAGYAEVLRQIGGGGDRTLRSIADALREADPSQWAVWLLGHLPEEKANPAIAQVQDMDPSVHFALSVFWSFARSWIARHWEPNSRPQFLPE